MALAVIEDPKNNTHKNWGILRDKGETYVYAKTEPEHHWLNHGTEVEFKFVDKNTQLPPKVPSNDPKLVEITKIRMDGTSPLVNILNCFTAILFKNNFEVTSDFEEDLECLKKYIGKFSDSSEIGHEEFDACVRNKYQKNYKEKIRVTFQELCECSYDEV